MHWRQGEKAKVSFSLSVKIKQKESDKHKVEKMPWPGVQFQGTSTAKTGGPALILGGQSDAQASGLQGLQQE